MFLWELFILVLLPFVRGKTFVINVDDYLSNYLRNLGQLSTPELRDQGITFNSDADLNIIQWLEKYNYPYESHFVTTEDGYILQMFRLPSGRNQESSLKNSEKRPAVLLMHGLLSSAGDWVTLGPEQALALQLADAGYDVWLGNNRGNTWSRNHTTLDPNKDRAFWEYSFHELGVYDLPAKIDYILQKTGHESISYVGHSQGCSQFFALATMKPEYNKKITIMAALAPPVYMGHIDHPILNLLRSYYGELEVGLTNLNVTEVFPHSNLITLAAKYICGDEKYANVCATILFIVGGFDSPQFNRTLLPAMLSSLPAGGSLREFKHYEQEITSGKFRQFDHGVIKNMEIYKQPYPPDYNISLATAPIGIFYSKNDWLVSIKDVDQLSKELPNLMEKYLIEYDLFTHLDYLVATDVYSLCNVHVINTLNKYNGWDPTAAPHPGNKGITILSYYYFVVANVILFLLLIN